MKISVNWLREYTSVKLSIDELVAKIGAQLGEVEEVVDYGKPYQDVVVAKVVACEPHPNADKLSVCLIDDGGKVKGVKRDSQGLVQVVCGAPNVRKGLTIAWLPPGSIVPSTYNGEQFKLEVRPLRGVDSSGMIASAKELDINDDHDGILVIDKPAKPGSSFAELYELNDHIIEVENKMFTHRPDLFGILGLAREVAGIQGVQFKSPEWYLNSLPLKVGKPEGTIPLKIKNSIPKLVPRFVAVALGDLKVTKSPVIMQTYLRRMGVKPINNVVDITNFVMLLTAQPLHAYDADKLPKPSLETRLSRKGDKLIMLNGKTATFNDDSTMLITSGDIPVGVAGAIGGRDTEVDFSTKNIILECANFDMYAVRRTSMKWGLFTDAVTRFNKGQSPLQNDVVLAYAVGMLQKLANAELTSDVMDTAPDKSEGFWKGIHVSRDFINVRLGLDLNIGQITKLLKNVEMGVSSNANNLIASPPFWRTDLEIPEDIVEEVGRLYGYDHLPLELPKRDLAPARRDGTLSLKAHIRNQLAGAGANEVLTYSFVHGELLSKAGQVPSQAYQLSNALSPDLQYYRLSLTPSLLDKVHMNIKAGFDEFALFELSKVHSKTELDEHKLPIEFERLALVIAAEKKHTGNSREGAAFYLARRYLQTLCGDGCELRLLSAVDFRGHKLTHQMVAPYDAKRSAAVVKADKVIGVVGEYRSSVKKQLKLPDYTAGFELFLSDLAEESKNVYRPLSRFPGTHQDISFKLPEGTTYGEVKSVVDTAVSQAAKAHNYVYDLEPVDIYQKGKADKHMTFRISLSHYERTLVTEEVNKLLDEVAKAAKAKLKAVRL